MGSIGSKVSRGLRDGGGAVDEKRVGGVQPQLVTLLALQRYLAHEKHPPKGISLIRNTPGTSLIRNTHEERVGGVQPQFVSLLALQPQKPTR